MQCFELSHLESKVWQNAYKALVLSKTLQPCVDLQELDPKYDRCWLQVKFSEGGF